MKQYRISDLISSPPKGFRTKDISDYASIDNICKLWYKEYYEEMCLQIKKYGDFVCFKDLVIYLSGLNVSDLLKHYIYTDIYEEYLSRLDILVLMRKDKIR